MNGARRWILIGSLIAMTAGASGVNFRLPAVGMADVRAQMDRQLAALAGIVMREHIQRFNSAKGRLVKVDGFDAAVEMADGGDSFTWLRRNGRSCEPGQSIRGAWSAGEFSTVLRISREALEGGEARLTPGQAGTLAAWFHSPASERRWYVEVAGRIYWLDFDGEVDVSAATAQVQRICWTSYAPEPESGITQVRRSITFAAREVAGDTYVLPREAEYRVLHPGTREEWNVAKFDDAARYGSVVSVTFAKQ